MANSDDNPFKGGTLTGYDYVLLVDQSHPYRTYGISESSTEILGTVTVSGDLLQNQQVNLRNLIMDTLIIDIGDGDILLDNVHPSTTIVISAGNHSVKFKNNCTITNLKVTNKKPVHLHVLENGLTCKNIILNPSNKAKIKLSGNFKNSNITAVSSLNLEAGENFKSNLSPQIIIKNSFDNEIILGGNFSNINSLLVKSSSKIIGNTNFLPQNLNLHIEPQYISSNNFELLGNLSKTSINIKKQSNIKCYSNIASINIDSKATNSIINIQKNGEINNLNISTPVIINGDNKKLESLLKRIDIQEYFNKKEITQDITNNYLKNLIKIKGLNASITNITDNKGIFELYKNNAIYKTFLCDKNTCNKDDTQNVNMTLQFNKGSTTVYKKITVKTKYNLTPINQSQIPKIHSNIKVDHLKETSNTKNINETKNIKQNKNIISKIFDDFKNSFA